MIKYGSTRTVFLMGSYAFKVPAVTEWRLLLLGLLANMQEACFSRTGWPELCPVVLSIPGGWLVVMRRAQPLSMDAFERMDVEQWKDRGDYIVPVENKLDSFGVLDGNVVAVDYGS